MAVNYMRKRERLEAMGERSKALKNKGLNLRVRENLEKRKYWNE